MTSAPRRLTHRTPCRPARLLIRRLTLTLIAASLATLGLAGCTSTDSEYCRLIEQDKQLLADLSLNVNTLTAGTVTKLRAIEAVAPSDVKANWTAFNDYLQAAVDRDDATMQANADALVAHGKAIDQSLSKDCRITMPTS